MNFLKSLLQRILPKRVRAGTGEQGEALAARHLIRNGYRIIERNWRCSFGEVDIIAVHKDVCVFVEVKSSGKLHWIRPEDRVRSRKQAKLRKLAHYYVKRQRIESPCRFDVIAVWWENGEPQLKHLENAF